MFYFFNANYYIHHKLKKTYIYIYIYLNLWETKALEKSSSPTRTARKDISSVIGHFNELLKEKGWEKKKKMCIDFKTF